MDKSLIDDPMLEAFIFETSQILETLEQAVMQSEQNQQFTQESINEIFRLMHTIKGSAAMMMFNNMSSLAHKVEDVFYIIRENHHLHYDFSKLIDLIFESIDFIKIELMKIKNCEAADGDAEILMNQCEAYLDTVKKENDLVEGKKEEKKPSKQKYYIRSSCNKKPSEKYQATLYFQENCEMENIRAYTVIHDLIDLVKEVHYTPADVIDNDQTMDIIRKEGFALVFESSQEEEKIKQHFKQTVFLEHLDFKRITNDEYKTLVHQYTQKEIKEDIKIPKTSQKYKEQVSKQEDLGQKTKQSMISVHVDKLDKLMDMVGEMVIAEAMVTQNPEIHALEIESFEKASRQLRKITSEMQDMVMSIRMVPLSTTFMKLHRIVRDMTKKLNKNVMLHVSGEETEVDKNIIEKISDPLMHIVRNAIDHGIEEEKDRISKGKEVQGTIELEAKNVGSDVLVIIKDDGKGLNKEVIYDKAREHGLIKRKIHDLSDREIYHLILTPGFSTNDTVTEYSGRGVGMDVVAKNIESIGGSVLVDSEEHIGTTIILKIPLTLAIIEGMTIRVGDSRFTIPIIAIQESFRPELKDIIRDTEGNEMIMVRGKCYPIFKLHEFYHLPTSITAFNKGILIMVEEDGRTGCLFADELLGQHQVVVKALPEYIKKHKKIKGLGGCTILGDGNISLILDVGEFNLSAQEVTRHSS